LKILFTIIFFILTGCANKLVQDPFSPSIDTGYKRVETIICGTHQVGENGCVFKEGILSGTLKIFKVAAGEISLKGCGLDKSYVYAQDENNSWFEIPLSGTLQEDCVVDIYQKVIFPGQEKATFPIYGIVGTVSFGVCPKDIPCDFKVQQHEIIVPLDDYQITGDGQYLIRGCGVVVEGPKEIHGPKNIRLDLIWPGGYPRAKSSCLFVTGIKGVFKQKRYFKINLFGNATEFVSVPDLKFSAKEIEFTGDQYVSLTMIDGKAILDRKGKFEISPSGNYLRFYTVNGRSLVVFIKDGEVVWTK
jgi:hypothetical protein